MCSPCPEPLVCPVSLPYCRSVLLWRITRNIGGPRGICRCVQGVGTACGFAQCSCTFRCRASDDEPQCNTLEGSFSTVG